MNSEWATTAIQHVKRTVLAHRNFLRVHADLHQAMFAAQPGEVIVLVGPSRVGKLVVLRKALDLALGKQFAGDQRSLYVLVNAENSSVGGLFSTKSFMARGCRAIGHPLYGAAKADDEWNVAYDRLIARTPESLLRDGFEHGLRIFRTKFIIFDETQHVGYAFGGRAAAARILDSWKCLAWDAQSVLVLVGSYELLDLISLAPHLLGRQQPIELSRYRSDSLQDIQAFDWILAKYSEFLRLPAGQTLRDYNRLLFAGSIGCVGHLNKWLRNALARLLSRELEVVSEALLKATAMPRGQQQPLEAAAACGEVKLQLATAPSSDGVRAEPIIAPSPRARRTKPFQKRSVRTPRGGRL